MSELFWFPLNSLTFLLNVSLWVLAAYVIYEGAMRLWENK